MGLRENREAAFGDEVDASRRHGIFDRVHEVVEADAEVGVVPSDSWALELCEQEPQILLQHVEIQDLIRHRGIDAEAACVRAAQARDHRDQFEEGGLAQRRLDEFPSFAYAREFGGLMGGRQTDPGRRVSCAVPKDIVDHGSVGESQDVVKVPLRVLRVAARVRSAQRGDHPPGVKLVAQGIRELRRFRERPDENQVEILRELRGEVLKPGVTPVRHLVPCVLAPDGDHLWHNARQVGVHHPCP